MLAPSQAPRLDELEARVELGSNWTSSTSESAKVTSVVHSAIQRALLTVRLVVAADSSRMNSAPTSGRKVTRERSGQLDHQRTPAANMNQVTSAATPISMAKA